MFGEDCVDFKDGDKVTVNVDGAVAHVDPETRVSNFIYFFKCTFGEGCK